MESNSFTLYKAGTEDINLIRELASKVWYHTYATVHTQEQLDYMFDKMYSVQELKSQINNGHIFYLAFNESIPVGYMSVQRKEKDLFYLEKLYVMPDYQGTGAGKFLFKSAISVIKEMHPGRCTLELNVNRYNKAIEFYKRMGMERFRERDIPIGNGYMMNSLLMRMRI